MSTWEQFEIDAVDYLQNKFGEYADFNLIGGHNSYTSDIEVLSSRGRYFIEAKKCPAQSGQFVLHSDPIQEKFIYSNLNVTPLNLYSNRIISNMNADFYKYVDAGTSGKEIIYPGCEQDFANWIIYSYRNKNTTFIITNGFRVFRLNDFDKAFDVSATFRAKKSGSSTISKTITDDLIDYLSRQDDFDIIKFEVGNSGKLFVFSKKNLKNIRFNFNNKTYMFSQSNSNYRYEIRRLSNTCNSNVIFSIQTTNFRSLSEIDFIRLIQ